MAHEEQSRGPVGEVLFQPRDRVDIEVVGGLVEDEHIGLGQQEACQCHPHPPTARHLLDRTVGVAVVETQSGEHLAGLGFERIAAHCREPPLHLSVFGQNRVLIGGRILHLGFEPVETFLHVGELACARDHFFDHGSGSGVDEILRQVSELHVARLGDLPLIGFAVANEDLDERGLAGAVATHQSDASTSGEFEGDVAEQLARAIRLGES